MVNQDRRAQIAKLRSLQSVFPDIGDKPEETYVGKVAIIGASNASGFGANLGRAVLNSHPLNSVILTARGRKIAPLRETVSSGQVYDPKRTEVIEFDVTHPYQIGLNVNHLVVCPAYMNPEFLRRDVKFEDIPEEEIQCSRDITVKGFVNAAQSFSYFEKGAMWGVSFAGHDFPGYNIGPIKRELESMVTSGGRVVERVRQNILSLGIFESVAGLGIQGFDDTSRIYGALGIENPTLRDMVYGATRVLSLSEGDRIIFDLDGGLREARRSKQGKEKYKAFCDSLK